MTTPAQTTRPKVRASDLIGRNWLNTGGKQLALEDFRGKVLILDFCKY